MKKCFLPYIYDFFFSLLLFIGVPAVFIATDSISLSFHGSIGILIFGVSVLIYIYFLASYFVPGIYTIMDLITRNFVTEKLSYVEGYIANNKFYGFGRDRKSPDETSQKMRLVESFHVRLVLANNKGKTVFRTTQFHVMEAGKIYTVQYAKHSKIVISITSPDGKQMLLGNE